MSETREASVIVVVAMVEEAAPFVERASTVGEARAVGAAVLRELEIDGVPVLLVQSGIGFVNAAAALTTAIAQDGGRASAVFSAGTAGGLGAGVRVGDVVVGSDYINMDADARVFGYVLGQVPGMPAGYPGAAALLEVIHEVDAELTGGSDDWHVRSGLIASSYSFVTSDRAAIARSDFPTVAAVDMESSALAQVCYSYDLPFLSVRGISDLAEATAAADFVENTDRTAGSSADVVLALARRIRS